MFRFNFKLDQKATSLFENKSNDGTNGDSIQSTKDEEQQQEWLDAMEIVPSEEIVETLDYCELQAIDTKFGDDNNTGDTSSGSYTIRHIVSGAMLEDIKNDVQSAVGIGLSEKEHSDLLPGVYEGGAKIWECTNDLIDYILRNFDCGWWQGKRVLDLGCGSGLLGIYAQKQGAIVHYQDYNRDVLEKITIPNVLMNMSNRGKGDNSNDVEESKESNSENEDSDDSETTDDEDNQESLQFKGRESNSKLEIKTESDTKEEDCEPPSNKKLKLITSEITSSLSADNSSLVETLKASGTKFYAGDWSKYSDLTENDEGFDLILSSETIYNPQNQSKLLHTFAKRLKRDCGSKILLAAKTHYFGVGGGTRLFELAIQEHGAFRNSVVWQSGREGCVQREILELSFNDQKVCS